jgi:hypothetical protein
MADKHDHLHENGQGEVSDETIRRFLLGCLSASEQPAFERRLFSEDGLDSRVRLAELDLADDYAYRRLSEAERALFEEKFLVSADRLRQVEVSSVLRERFASTPVLKKTFVQRLRTLPAFTQPVWRYAFAVAILLGLIGTTWLVIREPRFVQQIVSKIRPRRSTPRSAPREAGHPTNTSSPEHVITPSPMPAHDQTSSSSVSIAPVFAAASNNNVPSVTLPKGDQDLVRVQLAVKLDPGVSYRAELWSADGQSIFSAESLRVVDNGGAQIDFDVPARLLRTGDYQVRLSRDNAGTKENVGSFYFRVQ